MLDDMTVSVELDSLITVLADSAALASSVLSACTQIVEILDLMKPESYAKFDDVYVVNELMNTDLHQIIYSSQPLTDEHGQ